MSELKQMLVQFKQVTVELIKVLKQDEIYKLDELLNSRQTVIENMEKFQCSTEEFRKLCSELDILNAEKELSELMLEKKESTKCELDKIQVTRSANRNYNKSFYANSGTFDKQI
ncbi:hypothetical protein [Clostridium sp.]|uniref:hypothetical protein n=1 Tax=Clostridium sp. TaxID=1506 RepID=UPI003D6CF3B1